MLETPDACTLLKSIPCNMERRSTKNLPSQTTQARQHRCTGATYWLGRSPLWKPKGRGGGGYLGVVPLLQGVLPRPSQQLGGKSVYGVLDRCRVPPHPQQVEVFRPCGGVLHKTNGYENCRANTMHRILSLTLAKADGHGVVLVRALPSGVGQSRYQDSNPGCMMQAHMTSFISFPVSGFRSLLPLLSFIPFQLLMTPPPTPQPPTHAHNPSIMTPFLQLKSSRHHA